MLRRGNTVAASFRIQNLVGTRPIWPSIRFWLTLKDVSGLRGVVERLVAGAAWL